MKILYDWIKEIVEIKESPEELAEVLTSIGLESEVEEKCGQLPDSVVVGKVLSCEKHPNADKLSVCIVDVGEEEPLQIICGANNVREGIVVPVAKVGSRIPGLPKLKRVKIRSVVSNGMICSERELGISDEHEGIMILPDNFLIGKSFRDQYQAMDTVIEIDVLPNRPDCFGHIGVARDIGVYYNREIHVPAVDLTESSVDVGSAAQVEIIDPHGCPRYAARVIKGVKVAPSPEWLRRRIEALGMRSINNVVDASNYVLFETGHPLHTFDYNLLSGKKIIVRFARDGEVMTTLDGQERKLTKDILLICDAEKPVALAGIMGGENSEVDESTTDILIESAYFDPGVIRKGSTQLELSTEASKRFERGADPEGVIYALNRLAMLIQQVAGGEILRGYIDVYPGKEERSPIKFRKDNAEKIIGVPLETDWVKEKFMRLGCTIQSGENSSMMVIPPTFRPDLEREIDLTEELARLYGMWNIPSKRTFKIAAEENFDRTFDRTLQIREYLVSQGMSECYCNSLVSLKSTQFPFNSGKEISIYNPLGTEMGYMRTSLIPGLLDTVKLNLNNLNRDLSLFEIGNVFFRDEKSETSAKEFGKLALIVTGNWLKKEWYINPQPNNLYRLKGIIESLVNQFSGLDIHFRESSNPYFNLFIIIESGDCEIGYLGLISALYLRENWDIDTNVYISELDLGFLLNNGKKLKFKEFSTFPTISRDLSIILDNSVKWEDVEAIVSEEGGKYLDSIRLYDLYRGKNIESDKKSFTFTIVFQAKDKTLKDSEVDSRMNKIIKKLSRELKATLR